MPDRKNSRILIVDDDPDAIRASSAILRLNGFSEVDGEIDSRRVLDKMSTSQFDAVILDIYMPHLTGIDLLPRLTERYPEVPVIVSTTADDLKLAISCMKLGAFDFLLKPVESDLLAATLCKALERKALTEQVTLLRDHLINDVLDYPSENFGEIVTCNRKMRAIFQYLEIISASCKPIMITGESGTGKELIARSIYHLSGCKGKLVAVNLAGLDDLMFSDTLFGHKRGAFTGADQMRDGLIVKAENGVLFLDEIGDLSESSQVRLLRLLQENEFYPIGSDIPVKSKTRIVCASNKDIKQLVASGQFRIDLYYRLNTHHVSLPPLRSRKEDIPLLLDHFICKAAHDMKLTPPVYPKVLLNLLAGYNFPGNIRELEGMVQDAVARSKDGRLSLEPFQRNITGKTENPEPPRKDVQSAGFQSLQQKLVDIWGRFPTLSEADDFLIDVAIGLSNGNKEIAATMLGLKPPALYARLRTRKKRI